MRLRRLVTLGLMSVLAACSGGGGSGSSTPPTTTPPGSSVPQSTLVTPTFTIVVPGTKTSSGVRKPSFISSGTQSVVVTLISVGGAAPTVTPTSAETDINGATCAGGCVVNGVPSPPGVADTYTITTYDATGGTGKSLDTVTTTFTPTVGKNNPESVVLQGIPAIVVITVPGPYNANQTYAAVKLPIIVEDADGQSISGTYANAVRITDPDTETTNGTSLTGTNAGSGCTTTCVDLTKDTDTASFAYGGLAENPVTVTASGTGVSGSAKFTPVLNAITYVSGPEVSNSPEIDLYTALSTSPVGYSGVETFAELGFTNAPYNKKLSVTGTAACSGFASVATGTNAFTATSIASPTAGGCTVSVTDSLTDQTNTLPTFLVTYTTSSITGSAVHRKH